MPSSSRLYFVSLLKVHQGYMLRDCWDAKCMDEEVTCKGKARFLTHFVSLEVTEERSISRKDNDRQSHRVLDNSMRQEVLT